MAESITNVLGVVGMKTRGAYNSETSYEKLNVVTYNGSSYCAKTSTQGNLPTDTIFWDLIAEKGDKGDKGDTPIKGTDYYTAADKAELEATLSTDVTSEVTDQLSDLTSATPIAVSSTSGMTDTSRIYVLTTDGHWYWYNGTVWTDGGVYQAASVTDDLENLNADLINTNTKYTNENQIHSSYVNAGLNNASWDGDNLTVQAGGYAFFLLTLYPRPLKWDYYITFDYSGDLSSDIKYRLQNYYSGATITEDHSFEKSHGHYLGKIYYDTLNDDKKFVQIRIDNRNGASAITLENFVLSFNIYKDLSYIKENINKTVYVATNGNDNNLGTEISPFKTIKKGIEKGDIVIINPGEYFEDFPSENITKKSLKLICPYGETKAKINFSEKLGSTSTYNAIKRVAYSATSDDDIYKVFVSQTLSPTVEATWNYPRVALWSVYSDISNDIKLTPVLSLALCESTPDSFYYDGTYIYINNSGNTYYLSSTKKNGYGLRFRKIENLYLENLDFCYGYVDSLRIDACNDVVINNCSFNHSNSLDGIQVYSSNIKINNSNVYKNNNDGFGFQLAGSSTIINCDAYYNGQDGLSHHDNCNGNVYGGYYHHNGKAGISTPTYGAYINLYNIISLNNRFGFQIYAEQNDSVKPIIFNNCVGLNSSEYDLQISKYEVLNYNSKFSSTNILNDGSITNL